MSHPMRGRLFFPVLSDLCYGRDVNMQLYEEQRIRITGEVENKRREGAEL